MKQMMTYIFIFFLMNANNCQNNITESGNNNKNTTNSSLNNNKVKKISKEKNTQYLSASILILLILMIINNLLLIFINDLKEKYPKYFFWIQKSSISILLGIIIGLFFECISATPIVETIKSSFQNAFMILILPPILFEATLNMNRKKFFNNIGSISLFSFWGTFIAIFVTAFLMYFLSQINILNNYSFFECLIFGCWISATDPVSVLTTFKEIKANKDLYSLIFGESILNDAITLVFYKSIIFYNKHSSFSYWSLFWEFFVMILSSIFLGLFIGVIGSFLVKIINQSKIVDSNYALTVVFIVPWVSYLLAESLQLSGIVTIMFCGISLSSYSLPMLNENNNNLIKNIYLIIAENFENLAFILIGISLFGFTTRYKELGFISFFVILLILLVARYFNIYFLSYFLNKFKKNHIPNNFKFVLWFSGLRGAMAFSLALMNYYIFQNNVGSEFLTLTINLTIFSIIFLGILLEPVIKKFEVDKSIKKSSPSCFQNKFLNIENKYLRKYFKKKIDSTKEINNEFKNNNNSENGIVVEENKIDMNDG